MVGERSHVIRLMHRDRGLSLDVEAFDSFATAEEYGARLAGFLDLPEVVVAGSPDSARGDAAPAPRRSRSIQARRPRFLTRRHSGHPVAIRRVDGREIIARS